MAMKLYSRDPLKMFEDVFNERVTPFFNSMMPQSFKVDIGEDEKAFYLSADLPGVKKEDVKVSMDEDVLCISAERSQEEEEKGKNYHRMERSWGTLTRSFNIGDHVDSEHIAATYDNGVLKITIPKMEQEEKKSKEIQVS